jgi:hypothetical protein
MYLRNRENRRTGKRSLRNKELQTLRPPSNNITVIKSRRTRQMWHIVRMKEIINAYIIYVGNLKRPLRNRGVNERIILKEIKKHVVKVWTACTWHGIWLL